MCRSVEMLLALGIACMTGCGAPSGIPPLHPIQLVFPPNDCRQVTDYCEPWKGCYALGVKWLKVRVGPASPEETTVLCDVSAPGLRTRVYFRPGHESYELDGSYTRGGETISMSAGPFSEDDNQTPWVLMMR